MKTVRGIDFMHKLLTAVFCFLAVSVFGANPDFRNFNVNQFGTQNFNITIKSGVLLTNPIINSGTITGDGSGLTNFLARAGVESLAAANVINVTNFGCVPYIPPNFATGAFPTNAADCTACISNAMRFASNSVAGPRVVYFPPGIYKITNTITVPPLTSIKGEGWLHQSYGATRVATAASQIATNNWSVIWWAGNTNGTALRVPYNHFGPQYFNDFEICGVTNCMLDLGQGFVGTTIETMADTNRGFCGINFDTGTFCGGQIMENVTITGFKIGVNHAGNYAQYLRCAFSGNNIGFICTNLFAPDQVILRQCSIGNRVGGLGYYIANGRGWIIEDPSDIDYYTLGIFQKSQITMVGGNSEANATVPPSWTFFAAPDAQTYYISNSWPFAKNAFFIVNALTANDASKQGNLTIIGGQYSGNKAALVADHGGFNSASAAHTLAVFNTWWDCTNTYYGLPVLQSSQGYISDSPHYVGNGNMKRAVHEVYRNFPPIQSSPTYISVLGARSVAGDPFYQIKLQSAIFGGLDSQFTNATADRHLQLEAQAGTTTGPDWLQTTIARNYLSTGVPTNFAVARIMLGDPGLAPDGSPLTNLTLIQLKALIFTNTGTAYIPTNTAPYTITTNNFVLNAFNTNVNQRAYVQASIFLANSAGGSDVAKVGLYLDQDGNGVFEQTGIEVQNTELSVNGTTMLLNAYLQPGARFMFTNLSTGGATGVQIIPGSCQWVKQ